MESWVENVVDDDDEEVADDDVVVDEMADELLGAGLSVMLK